MCRCQISSKQAASLSGALDSWGQVFFRSSGRLSVRARGSHPCSDFGQDFLAATASPAVRCHLTTLCPPGHAAAPCVSDKSAALASWWQ